MRKVAFLKNHDQSNPWIIVFFYLALVVGVIDLGPYLLKKSCTIFTAVQGETVLYGNSEDQHNPDPVIGFLPPRY